MEGAEPRTMARGEQDELERVERVRAVQECPVALAAADDDPTKVVIIHISSRAGDGGGELNVSGGRSADRKSVV